MDQTIVITTIDHSHKDVLYTLTPVNILLEGELDFIVGEEHVSLDPYDAMMIPPNGKHASRKMLKSSIKNGQSVLGSYPATYMPIKSRNLQKLGSLRELL